ncbi:MAG: hypothetical protein GJ680_18470 [Alteromonadaceae bacterium]|nr:hypothetical protein [Alteromonadaceae bacterium]
MLGKSIRLIEDTSRINPIPHGSIGIIEEIKRLHGVCGITVFWCNLGRTTVLLDGADKFEIVDSTND